MITHRVPGWVVFALIGWLSAAACPRGESRPTSNGSRPTPDASRPVSLLDCVLAVAVRARQGGLTPEGAARLCHGSVSRTEVPTSWEVRTPFSDLSIIANQTPRPTEPALEYSMTIGLAARVVLRSVATELGPYHTIAESKTSSVGFVGPGSTAQIYAELFSSKVLPDAPVIEIVARAPHVSR